MHGHEFLDEIRSVTVWKRTKTTAGEKGVDLSNDVISLVAGGIIQRLLYLVNKLKFAAPGLLLSLRDMGIRRWRKNKQCMRA